jgi:phosphoribosylamine-glycine ligase
VAEKLNLPHPYSYKTSLDVTNKGLMKTIMMDNGLPTSPFVMVSSPDKVAWNAVHFPSVVKPVDCNSSKGVKRVDNREEAEAALANAILLSRTHEAILEGFNVGPEIQVDCLATSSGVKVMMTRQKQKIVQDGTGMVLQSFGSVFPAPLNSVQQIEVQSIAERIASAFGLRNTPFFYQAIITDEGINVLEFAPRVGGGLSYSILKDFGSYDAVEFAIDSYLGKELEAVPQIPSDKFLSSVLVYVHRGVFDHLEGFEDLISTGVIARGFIMKAKGDYIDEDLRSSNRVAAFVVSDTDYPSLQSKVRRAFYSIEAFNVDGEPMINRSIYPFA